jgi:hypothetical protein
MKKLEKWFFVVTFTDTFGGELNYCWIKKFTFGADSMTAKHALTLAKQEFFNVLPRHRLMWGELSNLSHNCAVKFDHCCIAATIELVEEDYL